jgi:hypothetical protein
MTIYGNRILVYWPEGSPDLSTSSSSESSSSAGSESSSSSSSSESSSSSSYSSSSSSESQSSSSSYSSSSSSESSSSSSDSSSSSSYSSLSSSSSQDSASSSSSSSSSSESSYEKGCVVYGEDTDVDEAFPRDFQGNWTGTADIEGSGDAERLAFEVGENEASESRYIGTGQKSITTNKYGTGKGNVTIEYATAATKADCDSAGWTAYSGPFSSSGWVKVRLST